MNLEMASETQVAELHAAFRVFSDATATLERQYRGLQVQARSLRVELEEKNRELTAAIERQRDLEVQALRQSRLAAMGEMAAKLAHEVRNPLAAMELFTRLLMDEIDERPAARRLCDQISRGIADLNHLVTNILDYTRLPEPNLASADIDRVIDEALLLAGAMIGPGIRVERRRVGRVLWSVDRGLMAQVLLNLFRNACEAMAGGGTLRIDVEPDERWLRIAVSDTGPGIPADAEETIFTPFYSTKARGTGLGLAVARAVILAHSGTLAVERVGQGATFVVTLPAPEGGFDMSNLKTAERRGKGRRAAANA
jgi:signal transduction histidine kinase